jgi:Raf kinase inhibitor-like YbhB/YbcL family protein
VRTLAPTATAFVACLLALAASGRAMDLTSSSFSPQGEIPSRHTCEGQDVSPALSWSGLPAGTRSLALIVDDPDAPDPRAPQTRWVHWILYNIPSTASGLPEGVGVQDLPAGSANGQNDWQSTGYRGPCPPIGRHRYFHRLYALDAVLANLGAPTRNALEQAMKGHVLAQAELVGTYQKR